MSDFAERALLLFIGALCTGLVGGIGFLIKRRLGREDPIEKFIAQHERLLAAQASETQPLQHEDRERIEQVVEGLHPGLRFQNALHTDEAFISQAEINMRAAQEADAALLSVNQLVERLAYRLSDEQRAVLRQAQLAWERYVDIQARLAAEAFAGGTIMPTIYHTERTALAHEREAAVNRVLDSFTL